MPDISDIVSSFSAAYPVQTLRPSQALDALARIRAAAEDVQQRTLAAAINPANLPTAQTVCAGEAARMAGLIRRIDDVYMPEMESLAADPATDTPGAGALVTVFYNAGTQTDPQTGETFTTPEYLAPAMARNACDAADQTMIQAYQELVEDVGQGAAAIATGAKKTLPLALVALGVGAIFVLRSK